MKRMIVVQRPVAPTLHAKDQEAQMRMRGDTRNVIRPKAIRKKMTKRSLDLPDRCRLKIFNLFICLYVCYPKYKVFISCVKIFHQNVMLCQHKKGEAIKPLRQTNEQRGLLSSCRAKSTFSPLGFFIVELFNIYHFYVAIVYRYKECLD